ncbi:MAG: hypothetical protein DRP42_03225 [Tenericutes bacterium]|nr:MAG: hypothetical protein DRP42_03225 [Mycoplasmatota bacterium]
MIQNKIQMERMNCLMVETETRMNDLSIEIPLSDWNLNIAPKSRKQRVMISLNLGSCRKKNIDKFVNWFEKNLFDVEYFGIKDKKKIYKFKLAKKSLFDFKPPVVLDNLSRGGIINSISFFDVSFIFYLDFNELINLLNVLKDRTHKDLDYFFIAQVNKRNDTKQEGKTRKEGRK